MIDCQPPNTHTFTHFGTSDWRRCVRPISCNFPKTDNLAFTPKYLCHIMCLQARAKLWKMSWERLSENVHHYSNIFKISRLFLLLLCGGWLTGFSLHLWKWPFGAPINTWQGEKMSCWCQSCSKGFEIQELVIVSANENTTQITNQVPSH